jgi:hypothetical protein
MGAGNIDSILDSYSIPGSDFPPLTRPKIFPLYSTQASSFSRRVGRNMSGRIVIFLQEKALQEQEKGETKYL